MKKIVGAFILLSLVILIIASFILWKRFSLLTKSHDKMEEVFWDGQMETITLNKGKLQITQNGKIIWQTPTEWKVDSFVLADSTNDGVEDLNLSVWKVGSFGRIKPFWFTGPDNKYTNHFFVFDFKDDKVFPVWQSSALIRPNCSFEIKKFPDGKNYLVTQEGEAGESPVCHRRTEGVWLWNGWGFTQAESKSL